MAIQIFNALNDAEGVLQIGTRKLVAASPGGDEEEEEQELAPVTIALGASP